MYLLDLVGKGAPIHAAKTFKHLCIKKIYEHTAKRLYAPIDDILVSTATKKRYPINKRFRCCGHVVTAASYMSDGTNGLLSYDPELVQKITPLMKKIIELEFNEVIPVANYLSHLASAYLHKSVVQELLPTPLRSIMGYTYSDVLYISAQDKEAKITYYQEKYGTVLELIRRRLLSDLITKR